MSLSEAEITQARIAFREITIFQKRWQYLIFNAIVLTNFTVQAANGNHRWVKWFGLLIVALGAYAYRLIDYRRLGNRYAGNVELLRHLGKREPGLLDSFSDPFAYPPFLDAWNRRLEKRALLWRLDRFLSGKGWPKS